MIRTEPDGEEVEPLRLQLSYERGRADRPWVMANFVTSVDGAATLDGSSSGLNDPDDMEMFVAMRAAADFILVGAGTVRAEDYGPARLADHRRDARLAAGLDPYPHLVVVSGSLDLDPRARVFSEPERHRVTVLTGPDAPGERVATLSEVADVVMLADTNPQTLIHYLRTGRVVLCEGGPTLMGGLVAAGLIDEMALTVAPLMVSGNSPRMAHGPVPPEPMEMRLDRVLYGDRSLFLRYLA